MTVADIRKDLDQATFTVVAEHEADAARVWELWANPRLLERWWGPPTHPATVVDHDFTPGGVVKYYMTGPEGEKYHGGWRVLAVDAPRRLEFEDFFADDNGAPVEELPTSSTTVFIEAIGGGTRMTIETRYESIEAMQQVMDMGMEEGIRAALGQVDALLAEQASA